MKGVGFAVWGVGCRVATCVDSPNLGVRFVFRGEAKSGAQLCGEGALPLCDGVRYLQDGCVKKRQEECVECSVYGVRCWV